MHRLHIISHENIKHSHSWSSPRFHRTPPCPVYVLHFGCFYFLLPLQSVTALRSPGLRTPRTLQGTRDVVGGIFPHEDSLPTYQLIPPLCHASVHASIRWSQNFLMSQDFMCYDIVNGGKRRFVVHKSFLTKMVAESCELKHPTAVAICRTRPSWTDTWMRARCCSHSVSTIPKRSHTYR